MKKDMKNQPAKTWKEKLKPSIGFIIFILLVSLSLQPLWQPFISIVAILSGLIFLLIYIKNRRKKNPKHQRSTIIDFLIPSKGAIIFIFAFIILSAWVGIDIYESHDAREKVFATHANHSNTKSYIDASFTKCRAGSTTITLGTSSVACNSGSIANSFATYFNSVNKNPYSTSTAAIAVSSNNTPALGVSHINYSDNTMTIITNVGGEDGGHVYTPKEYIVKE